MADGIENNLKTNIIPLRPVEVPVGRPAGEGGLTENRAPVVDRGAAERTIAFRSPRVSGSGVFGDPQVDRMFSALEGTSLTDLQAQRGDLVLGAQKTYMS